MRAKIRLRDFFPPGYDYERSCKSFIFSLASGFAYSLIYFVNYYSARAKLFYTVQYVGETQTRKVLREGVKMMPFGKLMGYSFLWFIVVFVVLLTSVVMQCLYYREGSKSIYLVKRLPDRRFVWRTCFAGPLIGLAIVLLVMGLLLAIYYGVYIGFTPAECLP